MIGFADLFGNLEERLLELRSGLPSSDANLLDWVYNGTAICEALDAYLDFADPPGLACTMEQYALPMIGRGLIALRGFRGTVPVRITDSISRFRQCLTATLIGPDESRELAVSLVAISAALLLRGGNGIGDERATRTVPFPEEPDLGLERILEGDWFACEASFFTATGRLSELTIRLEWHSHFSPVIEPVLDRTSYLKVLNGALASRLQTAEAIALRSALALYSPLFG